MPGFVNNACEATPKGVQTQRRQILATKPAHCEAKKGKVDAGESSLLQNIRKFSLLWLRSSTPNDAIWP